MDSVQKKAAVPLPGPSTNHLRNSDNALSGYTVYVSTDSDNDNSTISGMDILMMNQEVGQIPSNFPYRIVILLVFVWWNVFQFVAIKYLKRRDGPPLPEGSNPITFSMKSYYLSLKEAKKYPNLFRYLLCWFLFSDGIATMGTAAVLFATSELEMSSAETAVMFLEAMALGSFGCWLWLWIQRKIGWSSKQMILLHLTQLIVLSLYLMIGLIPNAPIGLVSKPEYYIYAVFWSLNFGSLGGFSRSIFASIVPVGKESEMFALFEITDKGSSWMGPLSLAVISNIASIRWGMAYCSLFFLVPIPILWFAVDMKKAVHEAGRAENVKADEGGTQKVQMNERATIVDTPNGHTEDVPADIGVVEVMDSYIGSSDSPSSSE